MFKEKVCQLIIYSYEWKVKDSCIRVACKKSDRIQSSLKGMLTSSFFLLALMLLRLLKVFKKCIQITSLKIWKHKTDARCI